MTLILTKFIAVPDRKLDHHSTKIVAGNVNFYQDVNMITHLALMYNFLQTNDHITLIVPLKNDSANCFRYLLIIARAEKQQMEGSAILGLNIERNQLTIDLIIPISMDLNISLDGNCCFKITSYDRRHIFKPINVRTLWNAYQSLHMLFNQARRYKGITYHWLEYYRNKRIRSNPLLSPQMANDEDIFRTRIYCKLKEIMLQVNLDEVTTKFLHEQLENAFEMSLSAYKHYIDNTMLEIFAQRDKATQILPYLYLGSQWNASDFEELKFKNIAYILNISDEIDNFFPEHFTYMNIRVYDNENVDLLKEWKKTFQFINKAKMNHQCCLVHCKMGVSRSASTVIAYLMKEYNHSLVDAFEYVKKRRSCIKPNEGFRNQLIVYEGILTAKKPFQRRLTNTSTNLILTHTIDNFYDAPNVPIIDFEN